VILDNFFLTGMVTDVLTGVTGVTGVTGITGVLDILSLSFFLIFDSGVQTEIFKPANLSLDFFFFFLLLFCDVFTSESFNLGGFNRFFFLNGSSVVLEQNEHLIINLFFSFLIDFFAKETQTFESFPSFLFMRCTIFFIDLDIFLPRDIRT